MFKILLQNKWFPNTFAEKFVGYRNFSNADGFQKFWAFVWCYRNNCCGFSLHALCAYVGKYYENYEIDFFRENVQQLSSFRT